MPDRVLLDPTLAPALAAAGLATASALLSLGGDAEAHHVLRTIDLPVEGTVGRFHLKRYHYPGWRRARHLLGRGTLWGRAPEMREFHALARLRTLGVPAVRPVAAAARTHRGRLVAHALLTEHVTDAIDLAARLRDPADPMLTDTRTRRRVLELVARHASAMHTQGFVHRDLHARNILVQSGEVPRVLFLDCRRGGAPGWRHGPVADLATLDGDLVGRVPATDRLRALAAYLPDDADVQDEHETVARRREKLVRRDRRRGRVAR